MIASFVGCGEQKPTEPVGTLTGVVYSGKEAIAKCRVKIFNKQTLKSSMKTVDENGRYEFSGVLLGDYAVAVLQEPWFEASKPPKDKRIPQRYRDVKKSGLTTTVVKGPNEYDIEMKK